MYRLLAAISFLLMLVTDYGSLGLFKAMAVMAAYIFLAVVFHNLAEKADRKRRKRKRAHRTGTSVSSMQQAR